MGTITQSHKKFHFHAGFCLESWLLKLFVIVFKKYSYYHLPHLPPPFPLLYSWDWNGGNHGNEVVLQRVLKEKSNKKSVKEYKSVF